MNLLTFTIQYLGNGKYRGSAIGNTGNYWGYQHGEWSLEEVVKYIRDATADFESVAIPKDPVECEKHVAAQQVNTPPR